MFVKFSTDSRAILCFESIPWYSSSCTLVKISQPIADLVAFFLSYCATQELAKAQLPRSRFSAGFWTEMSKSKMSIGTPCEHVVSAF
jgi:hypothetical protein